MAAVPTNGSESDALAISSVPDASSTYGTILDPVYAAPDSDEIVSYSRCGDSAIWTAITSPPKRFVYKVTGSQDAFANIQAAIAGIKSLADVTGNNLRRGALCAGFALRRASCQKKMQRHSYAAPWFWVGNTSRDDIGVISGLAVAYDMVDRYVGQVVHNRSVTRW